MWLLALGLICCFVWALVASVAAQEWRERALTSEDILADILAGDEYRS